MSRYPLRVLLLAIMLLVRISGGAEAAESADQQGIVVSGSGEVHARPDTAQVDIGVTSRAGSAAQALKENNVAMAGLFKVLAAGGIADKNIQTSSFSLTPQYDFSSVHSQRLTGYQAANSVRVKVRKLDSLGGLLDTVVEAGANQINSIRFFVADDAALMDQARREAIADARRKAELYAKAAGLKLGSVQMVWEAAAEGPVPVMADVSQFQKAAAVPVAPGEQEFHVQVTVRYGIR